MAEQATNTHVLTAVFASLPYCYARALRYAGDASLLQQARFPCDRRPMQLHNTTLALSALQAAGVQLQALPTTTGLVALKPEDLLDGDRERTLSLLWAIARTLQLGTVLKVGVVCEMQQSVAPGA